MPTRASTTLVSPHQLDIDQNNVACPAPPTPPPEGNGEDQLRVAFTQQGPVDGDEVSRRAVDNNTATGMSMMQEDTLYTGPSNFEEKMHTDEDNRLREEESIHDDAIFDEATTKMSENTRTEQYDSPPMIDLAETDPKRHVPIGKAITQEATMSLDDGGSSVLSAPSEPSSECRTRESRGGAKRTGISSIDQELEWSSDVKEWEFSHRRLRPQYPSATFQPYSKFKGTQQSDRQIYNVEVTVLTVDIEQASMSGYLQICGLTPDHPTLTTFFTGEIIGGPDQKYSFRTRDPAWGANDKTDLTHWARFPAWRPLSLQAKRNINFVYPLNHENWWQQEHIFMRWKEHFLVPDYKLKSIQGASFEGFYYICFNQIEGRVPTTRIEA
ncbi:uncharacterized protein Z518_11077 [Rhinocladiella mackenziei CBS 650.93]|uniref:Vesicle-mediated transport protein Vid24 n=1 Tax=Rhinocladiella mackenziei CBS 650.93 TaxID=1442369 RepID=A0A0D2ISC7_9EURO|nr:uncharacterized protein Z518_11077 [Rhinocladiella mackenziei CBS 650.93]KIW99664.1 hypothetical protein Z518_11077 [Rhinocladiella mackenziei CBS 650.93]